MRASTFPADPIALLSHLARARLGLTLLVLLAALLPASAWAGEWLPLQNDGIHDPRSRGLKILQEPAEALHGLTPDHAGNMVRWVHSLEKGEIRPRERLFPQTKVRKLDLDIIMNVKGGMPAVRFPHRQHTEWLDCANCHNGLFAEKTGGSKISMFKILQGEQCGVCHGAVAFPLTECTRCHSIPRPGSTQPVVPPGLDPRIHLPSGVGKK